MSKAKVFDDPMRLLSYAFSLSKMDGLNLEFGVFSGTTINHLSSEYPHLNFVGFDSFEGLPEDWKSGFEKGCFSVKELPIVNKNVQLVKGWFDNTLPEFLKKIVHIVPLYMWTVIYILQLKPYLNSAMTE